MHVTQLALLYAKEVGIRQSADTESAERDNRSNRLINDEAPRYDVDATRYADLAAILRDAFTGADTAFGPVARVSPRH
jgi:hypothetical protein